MAHKTCHSRILLEQVENCIWCSRAIPRKLRTVEHLLPKRYGGTNAKPNLAMACSPCNHLRGALDDIFSLYAEMHISKEKYLLRKDKMCRNIQRPIIWKPEYNWKLILVYKLSFPPARVEEHPFRQEDRCPMYPLS